MLEFLELLDEGRKNPSGFAHMMGESLAFSAPALFGAAAGGAAFGGIGIAAGLFGGGVLPEAGASIIEDLRKGKVNTTDEKELAAAFRDEKLMSELGQRGIRKGVTIASVDALTSIISGGSRLGHSSLQRLRQRLGPK